MACPKLFIPFANCHSLWENLMFYSIPNSPSWTWTCNFLFKCKEKLRNIFLNNDSSCTSCYLLGDTCVISNREKLADWIKVSLSQNLPGVWIISGLTVVVTYLLVMSVWKLFYIKKKKIVKDWTPIFVTARHIEILSCLKSKHSFEEGIGR